MLIIKGIDRSDAEYVRQIQSKSNKVTEEFYYNAKKYFKSSYKSMFSRLDLMDDIFQQSFVKLWIEIETQKIFGAITMFVAIIGIFTLIAGIVGVSNIMLVSVKERTREIGIRKAIGASPMSILKLIVLESIIITAIFGYIGMLAGIGLTEAVNFVMVQSAEAAAQLSSDGPQMSVFRDPTVNLGYVLISTLILIGAGVVAGYLPAYKAVRVKPIEAMRKD